jgi:hypothetical protein
MSKARFALPALVLVATLASCGREEPAPEPEDADTTATVSVAALPPVVEIAAVDYSFESPDTIPSGWTTLRFDNQGREVHFVSLWRLPDGKTLADYEAEVLPAFGAAYQPLEAGTIDKEEAGRILGERLPAWFVETRSLGGVGFTSPGHMAETIVPLEPGVYVMECYVKTAEGAYHGALGMLKQLVVTEASTGGEEPTGDAEITLTNAGIQAPSTLSAGRHTIAVRFVEHPEYGLGNDVHVARMEEGTDPVAVTDWMDWMNVEGLRDPAPVEFLGGLHEMVTGATGYFIVDLAPGRYAWVGESPAEFPRIEAFTVE